MLNEHNISLKELNEFVKNKKTNDNINNFNNNNFNNQERSFTP